MHEYQSLPTVVVQLEGGTYTLLIGRRCEQVGTLDFLDPLHCPLPAQPCSSTGRESRMVCNLPTCVDNKLCFILFIFAWQHEPQLLICLPQ